MRNEGSRKSERRECTCTEKHRMPVLAGCTGRVVQLLWRREDDQDCVCPRCLHKLEDDGCIRQGFC